MSYYRNDNPIPRALLATAEMQRACRARDLGAIFRLARDQGGVSFSQLARLCEMTPSRVGEYARGRARVRQQHVVERVADGLRIPGALLGLAPRPWEEPQGDAGAPVPAQAARPQVTTGATTGEVVELDLSVDIDIDPEGWCRLTYRHVLLNLTDAPLTGLARELWFERGRGSLEITAVPAGDREVDIRRVYDAPLAVKFTCRITPPVPPGETAVVEYECEGGRFVDVHYWRQAITRPTAHLTLRVRQRGIDGLRGITAVEEFPDGAEAVIDQHVRRRFDRGELRAAVSRSDLRPNQFVTLRWDVERDAT
jgi:transcriptional regulator with XRE-family HTH domain